MTHVIQHLLLLQLDSVSSETDVYDFLKQEITIAPFTNDTLALYVRKYIHTHFKTLWVLQLQPLSCLC